MNCNEINELLKHTLLMFKEPFIFNKETYQYLIHLYKTLNQINIKEFKFEDKYLLLQLAYLLEINDDCEITCKLLFRELITILFNNEQDCCSNKLKELNNHLYNPMFGKAIGENPVVNY